MRVFDAAGSRLSEPFAFAGSNSSVDAAIDAQGNFVVVRQSSYEFYGDGRVHAQRFASDGTMEDDQTSPSLALRGSGSVVAWQSDEPAGLFNTSEKIRIQRLSSKCTPGDTTLCLLDNRFDVAVS